MKFFSGGHLIIIILTFSFLVYSQETDFTESREELARTIVDNTGITSELVVSSFELVPRHMFLPDTRISTAYEDRTIPLGRGRFIPSPSDIGSLLSFSKINPDDRVFILGSSIGYTAALAHMIAGDTTIMELDQDNLDRINSYFSSIRRIPGTDEVLEISNVNIVPIEDLYLLSLSETFSLILIQAGVDEIPTVIFSLLEPGGKIAGALKGESGFSILFRFDMNNGGGRITTGKEVYLPFLEKWP